MVIHFTVCNISPNCNEINAAFFSHFRVPLPKPYTLHLINHNDTPCAISKEISSWFWEFDLLQYHLNKKSNPPSGQPIYLDKVPELYQLIVDSQSPVLWEAKAKDRIIVYSLEV